jgi:hypothetical protein
MADATYETRYCAFIDILGFSELIEKLDRGETPFASLQALLEKIHNPPPTNAGEMERSDFRAQSISDAVALSGADNILGISAIWSADRSRGRKAAANFTSYALQAHSPSTTAVILIWSGPWFSHGVLAEITSAFGQYQSSQWMQMRDRSAENDP